MIAKNVGYVRRVICGPPNLINLLAPVKHPKDLLDVPGIRFSGLSQSANWLFYGKDEVHVIHIKGPMFCN